MTKKNILVEPDVGIQPPRLSAPHLQPKEDVLQPRALPQALSQLVAAHSGPAVAPVRLYVAIACL